MFDKIMHWIAIATVVIMVVASYTPAFAQGVCGKHKEIVQYLGSEYKENRVAAGVASAGEFLEVYVSKDGGWTIIYTSPGGPTCVLASGKNWDASGYPSKTKGEML